MTDEQIKQNALEYSGCSEEWFNDTSYVGESTAYDDAHSFYDGAHSRDEEIEELQNELESLRKGFYERGDKLKELMLKNNELRNPWISVKDRLPERIHSDCDYSVECLIHCYDKEAEWNTVAQYNYAQHCWDLSDYDYNYETVVQFWIPIPKLNEGE